MTTPSSTSQSVFLEPRGMTMSSFGPLMPARGLHEHDRLVGDLGAGFGGVLGVVQADADELADAADAGADADRLFDQRQRFEVELAELVERRGARASSPAMSSTMPSRLRMWPAESRMPGCSWPEVP